MNKSTHAQFFCSTALLLLACGASAQTPKSAKVQLNGWDKNQDGLLDKSEIPASDRGKFEMLAKRKRINLDKGIPIKLILAGDETKPRKLAGKAKKETGNGKAAAKDGGAKTRDLRKSDPNLSTQQKPRARAKAFGDTGALKQASGFGSSERPATSTPDQNAPPDNEAEPVKAEESSERKRLRFLARAMLAQHDRNKSGRLEKNEWARLHGNPRVSDSDRDGELTLEELEGHLGGFATRERQPRKRRSSSANRSTNTSTRKSYRFLTPHERLPKGLPGWFADKDLDEDGQLSLREYASSLTQTELTTFRTLDLNNDGFVVASEYLKSTN